MYTSTTSLPAFFTSSNAPAKSPLNTFLTALAKYPNVSRNDSNLSTRFSLIAIPKDLTLSNGLSKIALKKSVIPPMLLPMNLAKSLKAICRVLNAVLKKSITDWLLSNNSLIVPKANSSKKNPLRFLPIEPTDSPKEPIDLADFFEASPMFSVLSAISLTASAVLSACFCESFNASISSLNFASRPERSAPITMFFSIAIITFL